MTKQVENTKTQTITGSFSRPFRNVFSVSHSLEGIAKGGRLAIFVFAMIIVWPSGAPGQWRDLFNGNDLSGWTQVNGSATYRAENGMIVGETVLNSPNSFLCTKETYSDFILEFEAKVEGEMNSGVQFRSHSDPNFREGRVYGYQIEIDPSERAWTGGVHEERRRWWLYTLEGNPKAKTAFRKNEWNKFRVEAVGSSIRTWLNGVQCVRLEDNVIPEGFIGLQVHSVGRDSALVGKKVYWKNLRIITTNPEKFRAKDDETIPEENYVANTLTAWEKKAGWRLLWDGRTANGWRGAKLDRFPEFGWKMDGGILTVVASGGAESRHGGDIVTTETFSDFELIVDFRITEGANSGIKYFVDPELNKTEGSAIGLEFQILDDGKHPDGKLGVNGNRTVAGLYDLIPPVRKRFNGVGIWNRARIVAKGSHVEHWLNGMKVVEYDRGTQVWRALVSHSKFKVWPNFGELKEGHILLQDHGDEVSFMNIKLRPLNGQERLR